MYTHCTHESVKDKIIEQFTKQSSLRVVIATIAFAMGIDCVQMCGMSYTRGFLVMSRCMCRKVAEQEEMAYYHVLQFGRHHLI